MEAKTIRRAAALADRRPYGPDPHPRETAQRGIDAHHQVDPRLLTNPT
jgi:hypothetical protein